jgi:nucleoside 2-deoxyribosyltransferase
MKKIYLAYKLSGSSLNELKPKLETISGIITGLGYKSFIFIRDVQSWETKQHTPDSVINEAMNQMKKSDAILCVVDSPEKSEGMLIEAGYMKGLGKKVIVAKSHEGRTVLLKSLADQYFEFENLEDLKNNLVKVFRNIFKKKS